MTNDGLMIAMAIWAFSTGHWIGGIVSIVLAIISTVSDMKK